MGKHTPGPWKWDSYDSKFKDADGASILDAEPGIEIEDAYLRVYNPADIPLIAAAPEMLDILVEARHTIFDIYGKDDATVKAIDQLLARIDGKNE